MPVVLSGNSLGSASSSITVAITVSESASSDIYATGMCERLVVEGNNTLHGNGGYEGNYNSTWPCKAVFDFNSNYYLVIQSIKINGTLYYCALSADNDHPYVFYPPGILGAREIFVISSVAIHFVEPGTYEITYIPR